jgi:hypothetical protein
LLATRFSFAVEGLRDRRRASHFTEKQNFHFEVSALSMDLQKLAYMDAASRLYKLSVAPDATEFATPGGKAACFEKSRCPEPLVDPNGVHILLVRITCPTSIRIKVGPALRDMVG